MKKYELFFWLLFIGCANMNQSGNDKNGSNQIKSNKMLFAAYITGVPQKFTPVIYIKNKFRGHETRLEGKKVDAGMYRFLHKLHKGNYYISGFSFFNDKKCSDEFFALKISKKNSFQSKTQENQTGALVYSGIS